MPRLIKWDQMGERIYETGVDRGVLYPQDNNGEYPKGEPWNGLTSVNENPTGAEPTPLYADNIKYLELMSVEEFGCTIEAYTYPDSFEECDGSKEVAPGLTIGQQDRKTFGFSYRTLVGNDVEGEALGYKLHLVYGCKASPSDKTRETINETPDAVTFSWEVTTTPVPVEGLKPTSKITIDSTKVDAADLKALEDLLYGKTEGEMDAKLPSIQEVIALFKD